MSTLKKSKLIKISIGLMLFINTGAVFSNYNGKTEQNESYAFFRDITTTPNVLPVFGSFGEFQVASFNYRYGNSQSCTNVKSCGTYVAYSEVKGRYEVAISLAGYPVDGGMDFQVIAVGNDDVHCKIGIENEILYQRSYINSVISRLAFNVSGSSVVEFPVNCYNNAGNLADSKFIVSTIANYSRNPNHQYASLTVDKSGKLGHPENFFRNGVFNTLFVFNKNYLQSAFKNSGGASSQKIGVGLGRYLIKLEGWLRTDINSVRLTPLGNNSNFCNVNQFVNGIGSRHAAPGTEAWVSVDCFDKKGNSADTGFNLLIEKSYKGPTGRGAQYTLAKKDAGAWTNWDYKGGTASLKLADYNSSIVISHKNYAEKISFPFVTSMSFASYCKIGSYKTRTVNATPFLDVKIRCFGVNSRSHKIANWKFSENLVSIN